jgi:hypothetical protein
MTWDLLSPEEDEESEVVLSDPSGARAELTSGSLVFTAKLVVDFEEV